MARITRIFGWALVAAGVAWTSVAAADDDHVRSLYMSIPSTPAASGDHQGAATKSPTAEDLSARIDQLEADRAALDQKNKSPISLSVSGWVSQQVTVTRP